MGWFWGIIVAIIAGGIIGFVARAIVPGKQDLSLPMTVGLGIVGMVLGQIVGRVIPPDNEGVPWILGIVCATGVLFAVVRSGNLSKISNT